MKGLCWPQAWLLTTCMVATGEKFSSRRQLTPSSGRGVVLYDDRKKVSR